MLIFVSFLVLFSIVFLALVIWKRPQRQRVCFNEHCFDVELAESAQQSARGLMFRKELAQDKGMLFIFPSEGKHSFWMKNTLIPLDIIWLNEQGSVVFIAEAVQPCSADVCEKIAPDKKAKYVLELNSGLSKQIGLAVGDKASIEYQ